MLHISFLVDHINNEMGIRYVYANPIIDMLCQALGYQVELEDMLENEGPNIVNVIGKSQADYAYYDVLVKR